MASSTLDRGSPNLRLFAALVAAIIGAPLLWLITLQTGYVLAYQACDDRSTSWVVVPTTIATLIAIGGTVVAFAAQRRAHRERIPLPLTGWLAFGMTALIVVVLAASLIAPLLLQPCD